MIKSFILTVIKYTAPLFSIMLPALVLYGAITLWQPATEVLSKYENDYVLLTGVEYHASQGYEQYIKTYLVLQPRQMSSKTISVVVTNNNKEIIAEDGGFLVLLLIYTLVLFATWYFLFKSKSHNKSLKNETRSIVSYSNKERFMYSGWYMNTLGLIVGYSVFPS